MISFFLLINLACNLPLILQQGEDTVSVPISTESVNELEGNVGDAAATAISGGSINLIITEEQLTSIAAFELQSMPEGQMIRGIQIRLRDGRINISGDVLNGNITLPFQVSLVVSADGNGYLQSQIESANVGPFPLPQNIIDQFTSQINQAIMETIDAGGNGVFLENIVLSDGYLSVYGHLR